MHRLAGRLCCHSAHVSLHSSAFYSKKSNEVAFVFTTNMKCGCSFASCIVTTNDFTTEQKYYLLYCC